MKIMPILPFLLVTILVVFPVVKNIKVCTDSFCPPIFPKFASMTYEELPVYLGIDNESGCHCREMPGAYVACFGRVHCTNVPQSFNITTPAFVIRSTKIAELKKTDFDKFNHLSTLRIEESFNLHRIEPGTFMNMGNLTNLSISYNPNLRKLDPKSFQGLINLHELYLVKNGFVDILDVSMALTKPIVPNLVTLSLSENTFVEIVENDFEPMRNSSVEELKLVLCLIEYIHPKALGPLTKLEALYLGINNFNASTITEVIRTSNELKIPLKLLNLFSIGFRKTPPYELMKTISKTNISNLSLSRNQFEVITADSFPQMPNIVTLDMREVLASNITINAFSKMPKLRTLLLNGNKLSTVPEGVILPNLTYLDLQYNSGSNFFPSYFSIFKTRFSNMKHLEYLDMSYNTIKAIYNTSFEGLTNLRILGLKNGSINEIEDFSFSKLKNLIVLNLENNFFVKNHPRGMEDNLFAGLTKLQVLFLGGNFISFISIYFDPFKDLKSLIYLGLERNNLITLSPSDFEPLTNLKSIVLSLNQLTVWQERVFTNNTKLIEINLYGNRLSYLTEVMLEDFKNKSVVKLDDNPFNCECAAYEVYHSWLENGGNDGILSIVDLTTYCTFPAFVSNITFIDYIKSVRNGTTTCEIGDFTSKLFLILPLLFLVALVVVFVFFLYYYRWHVRYWIFLARLYLSRKGKVKPKKHGKHGYVNYEYDAFVSYSNEDRHFVVRLVAMLENYEPFLKLCVYERDFQIGTVISETVLESVAKSRKTLLIISDSYAKSQWCRWESQIAEHHRLFFENEHGEYVDDSLVLVKLGPVSENHLTPTLKYLLKTRIYLAWDADDKKQKVFWEKLRGALAPPKVEDTEYTHI